MNEFILYSYFRSSASYRVRIAMNLKNIPYEYKAVHLLNEGGEQNQDSYKKLNPISQVPTLIHNGKVIAQSMAIVDYLEQVQPEPRLYPQDPYLRAVAIQACEMVNSGIQPLHNLSVTQYLEKKLNIEESKRTDWNVHWISKGLRALEEFLKPHSSKYSIGDQVSVADCFVIPQLASAQRFGAKVDSSYPTLLKIRENCESLEAFKKAAPGAQPDTPAT